MRDDLMALTPEALSSLSSIGLLKRAQRMMQTGLGPKEIEEEKGIVTATFDDGTTIALPPKATLAQARCSCGAVFACRHGLALVLDYHRRHGKETVASDARTDWNPGAIDDKEVLELIGRLGRGRANRLMRGGIVVRIGHDPHPTARLPTCTLQFLVPNDLTHARCDCELGTACEHLLIAVRAFRQAGDLKEATVELAATGEVDLDATRDATKLAQEVLWQGMSGSPEALDARFERVRQKLDADGQVWPVSVLDDLQNALKWYRARSARYRPELAEAIAELEARRRAVDHSKKPRVPLSMVLGTSESAETRLAELRMMSLGARARSEGSTTIADVFLVDADTGNVLVYRFDAPPKKHPYQKTEPAPVTGPEIAGREIAKGVRLGDLASGQLLTQTARRRANRQLVLPTSSGTQVVRDPGDWSVLGAPVRVTSLHELMVRTAKRAPSLLRPRVLAEDFHVFEVSEVGNVVWSAGEQALIGELVLSSGESIRLERHHRSAAPNAIAVLAKTLAQQPQWISGEVRQTEAGVILSPTALRTERGLIVPDLVADAGADLELGNANTPSSPFGMVLDDAMTLLDEAAHGGLLTVTNAWVDRMAEAATQLEMLGLRRLANLQRAVASAAKQARVSGRKASPEAPMRWTDARIALVLAGEMLLQPQVDDTGSGEAA